MAYIFNVNQKYYVLKDLGDNLADLHKRENIFEVDELLAYPVAELCNKGYVTEMSCSGHAFDSPSFKKIENNDDLDNGKDVVLLYEYLPKYEGNFVCCQGQAEPGTFIKFKKDINFHDLPKGWVYENHCLKFDLSMQINPSVYYAKLSESILILTEWIENLPEIKP